MQAAGHRRLKSGAMVAPVAPDRRFASFPKILMANDIGLT
jgi:hypothetical protein